MKNRIATCSGSLRTIFGIMLLALTSVMATPSACASSPTLGDVRWVVYPSLDINSYIYPTVSEATNNVQRLAEGPRYLYALITGNYYQRQASGRWWRNSPVVAARFDKLAPESPMTPLATLLPTSGINVDAMEYSPAAGCLALAYDNRAIDLIFDDGRLISNTELTGIRRPGGAGVRALQFDLSGSRLTAATDFGVLIIDIPSGRTLSLLNLGAPVDCANIVGGRLVISAGGFLRAIEADARPKGISDFPLLVSSPELSESRLISPDGNVKVAFGIYPLGEESFLFLGGNTSSDAEGLSANVLYLTDSTECRALSLFSSDTLFPQMGLRDDFTRFPREAALLSPTSDGLMLHTHNEVCLLDLRPLKDGSTGYANLKSSIPRIVRRIPKPSAASPDPMTGREAYKQLVTFDGATFHIFRPREGFQPLRTSTRSPGEWSPDGPIIRMNAPLAGLPSHIYYNPKHGITVHNQGRNTLNNVLVNSLTDGLSVFSGGSWRQLSAGTLNPEAYFSANSPVMATPSGGVSDPLDPDHIYTSARTSGLQRQNLSDPTDILLFTRSNYLPSHPGHITVVEPQTGSTWAPLCSFGQPDFDADGTMWTSFARIPSTDYPEQQAELWFWPAADRLAVKSPADYQAHPFRKIVIPGILTSQLAAIYAPRLPQNRNVVVHISGSSEYSTFFYDHNGTPDDTSDDRIRFLENAIDENGERKLTFTNPNLFFEDPYDGACIVSTVDGLIMLTRSGIFDSEDVHFSWINPIDLAGGLITDLGHGTITGITVDDKLRKWITTSTGSLLCLAPDRSRILAKYTSDNSPLPSAELMSVAYNPVGNSIFVGTDCGIAELILPGASHPLSAPEARVSPLAVDPDFNGYVTFSGLIDTASYSLLDEEGNLHPLPAPTDGTIQILSSALPHGLLRLVDASGSTLLELPNLPG